MRAPAVLDARDLANVTGGLPAAVATKAGRAAVARAYKQLDEINALRTEASRLWWSANPNDRSTALFMLKAAGYPPN